MRLQVVAVLCLLVLAPRLHADVIVTIVTIDVHPLAESSRIGADLRGTVRVAIPSQPGVTAADVEVSSLTFGATGDEASLASCYAWRARRRPADLLCHFSLRDTGLQAGHTRAVLKGALKDGTRIRGEAVLTVPSRQPPVMRAIIPSQ